MLKTLMELCALDGVSGNESAVREYIAGRISPFVQQMETDPMGNLIAFKKGKRCPDVKLMLAAHMDEVGIIVTSISDEGYLKFSFVGGVDRRVAIGKRVNIGGISGVIGLKAYHLVSASEEKKVPKTTEMYIDIGADSKEEAEKLVRIGDTGVFESDYVNFGEGMVKCRAIDDRIGCAAMIKLIEQEIEYDCYFAFTAQEEVGTRGAMTAAYRIAPDMALILEGTTAADLPTVDEDKQICRVKGGVVIPFMDRGAIYDRRMYDKLTALADERKIKWQTKEFVAGGTDASAIQRSRAGVACAGLAVPVRYIHSPSSVAATEDMEAMYLLAKEFINTER